LISVRREKQAENNSVGFAYKKYLPKFERFQLGIEAQKESFWLNFKKPWEDSPKRTGRSP